MKTKILLTIVIFFSVAAATQAQINKGSILLGGSLSVYHSNSMQKSFFSNIQIGTAIKNNTFIGLIGSYYTDNYGNLATPFKQQTNTIGAFYRKYKKLSNRFYFFGELQASYSALKNSYTYYDSIGSIKSKVHGGIIAFIPGISYSICKHFQMELLMPNIANFSYSHSASTDSAYPDEKTSSYSGGININSNFLNGFAIGFKFFL